MHTPYHLEHKTSVREGHVQFRGYLGPIKFYKGAGHSTGGERVKVSCFL